MFTHLLAPFLAASVAFASPAANASPDFIVSASWLREHLTDPNLIVLGLDMPAMKMPELYSTGHIPGARPIDFNAIMQGDGKHGDLTMELVSADSLRAYLESLGVNDQSHIVLYGPTKWTSAIARVFFTLDYLGLGDRTQMLDGGIGAWREAGGATETAAFTPTAVTKGSLHIRARSESVVNADFVKAHLSDTRYTIIDARAPEFYDGTKLGHQAARSGHIPGAANVYYNTMLDTTTGKWRSPDEARALLAKAGVPLDKTIVVYCHIGQTANVVYSQLRRLGLPVRLYDGSFQDWSLHSEFPVVQGADRGSP